LFGAHAKRPRRRSAADQCDENRVVALLPKNMPERAGFRAILFDQRVG
jgi:hypothetical protein